MDIGRFESKTADVLNVYKARNMAGEVKTGATFAEAFNDCFQKKLSAGNKISKFKILQEKEPNSSKSEKLKDKYCSLCGSLINSDGSCPMCIVPVFISGNGNINNQNIVQIQDQQNINIKSE